MAAPAPTAEARTFDPLEPAGAAELYRRLREARPRRVRRTELEVRTIATRAVADDDLDAITTFCAIASEANLRSRGVGRSAGTVRSLAARLGRVTARAGEPALWREPLAWVAGIAIASLVAASIKHTVAGTWLDDGPAGRSVGFLWVLACAFLALHAARRVRDPFSLDA